MEDKQEEPLEEPSDNTALQAVITNQANTSPGFLSAKEHVAKFEIHTEKPDLSAALEEVN